MKKQEFNSPQERRMKFAEAGVLFVLVLGLTIFIGVKVASRDGAEEMVAQTVVASETIAAEAPAGENLVSAAADHPAEIEAPGTTVEIAAPAPRIVTYAMAEKAYFLGNHDEAAELFNIYTDEHQTNAWGFYMLGLSQWKAGDPEAANDALAAALTLKPDHVKSLINRARVLIELDRSAEAREQAALALAASPESTDAARVMGRIQHNLGELDAAAASYRKVLRTADQDAWSLNNLGLIRIEQGRFAEALPALAKAAAIAPETACIQNNLGVALERAGQYTAAVEAFSRALAADEGYSKAEISRERVAALDEPEGLEPMDLMALAASFNPGPAVIGDMEVAAAAEPEAATPALEKDEPQN